MTPSSSPRFKNDDVFALHQLFESTPVIERNQPRGEIIHEYTIQADEQDFSPPKVDAKDQRPSPTGLRKSWRRRKRIPPAQTGREGPEENFIENDAEAYMFFTQMFSEVPGSRTKSPSGLPQVRDYQHMLRLFNVILTHAPSFAEDGLVGFPFNAILDWSMATVGGWAAFINEKVNTHIQHTQEWGFSAFAGEYLR